MVALPPPVAAVRTALQHVLQELLDEPGSAVSAGDLVLVAVSGGADSLALAAAVAHVAPRLGLRAGAVTVDHGLQAGSPARAEQVAVACRELGLAPVDVATVTVSGVGGPEAAARTARYDALAGRAAARRSPVVLTGHTRDDQAEGVLLALARGSGTRSLAGMSPVSRWPVAAQAVSGPGDPAAGLPLLVRPLLGVRRSDTVAGCAALGLEVWDDPHNGDPAYLRSRVRTELLPSLVDVLGPATVDALARTATLARADSDALDGWARQALAGLFGTEEPAGLDVTALAALPEAVRTRVLHLAAVRAGAAAGALAAGHVRALDALVTGWHGQGPVALPGGLVGERRCDRLTFR